MENLFNHLQNSYEAMKRGEVSKGFVHGIASAIFILHGMTMAEFTMWHFKIYDK